jgi:OmpA-OmpF porin, OOP family
MAFNLFNLIESEFSSDVVAKIASFIGEAPAKTQGALNQAVPAVMCALHQQAATTNGAADLFGMLQRGGFDGSALKGLAGMVGSGGGLAELAKTGAPLLGSLFGPRLNNVVDWLAGAGGIGKSASSSLLGLVVPFVLNLIGRQAGSTGGFNAASVANLIKGQAGFLGNSAPRGLAAALGVGQCGEVGAARASAAAAPAALGATEAEGGWLKWLLPVLAMLGLSVFGIWWYANNAGPGSVTAVKPTAVTAPAPVVTAPPAANPAPLPATGLTKVTICSGQEIDVAANGVESKLLAFLGNAASVVGGNTWFSFDRIEFETDSAVVKPSSRDQLRNIAGIMQCYPGLELKIGGYTDNVGDAAYNLKLSQSRADSTKAELVALGVAPSRLGAEGYGEQFPVASNDTEEGRKRNRRTDVSITKK